MQRVSGLDPDAAPDAAALDAALNGADAACGVVLATEAGAQAAVRAGVTTVVPISGQHPAILLLRLAQAGSPLQEDA